MRILLTNDDGIRAEGLWALKSELDRLGPVSVVAPATPQSGVGCTISIDRPIPLCERRQEGETIICSLDASPVDCVKLAFSELLDARPEMVVSGINLGANTGVHVFYSGTVAAALEGAMHGVPSFAVSLEYSSAPDLNRAAALATRLIEKSLRLPRLPVAVNINLPRELERIKGVKITSQCTEGGLETFEKTSAESGRESFQYVLNDPLPEGSAGSDREALREGYISLTPLCIDLTDHAALSDLSGLGWEPTT